MFGTRRVNPESGTQSAAGTNSITLSKSPLECPRQELNLIFDHRKVACESGTLRELFNWHREMPSNPPRNRTWSDSFEDCHAVQHTRESFD